MSDLSKAFISAGVLASALIISLIIAKIVDHCYDRASIRDDASDISEHTRNLIRARLAVRNFRTLPKKESDDDKDKNLKHKKILRMWSAKARAKSGSYPRLPQLSGIDEISESKSQDVVINIEGVEESDKTNTKDKGKEKAKGKVKAIEKGKVLEKAKTLVKDKAFLKEKTVEKEKVIEKVKPPAKVTIITETASSRKPADVPKHVASSNITKPEKTKAETKVAQKANESFSSGHGDGELPGTPISSKRGHRSRSGSPSKTSSPRGTSPPLRPRTAPAKGNSATKDGKSKHSGNKSPTGKGVLQKGLSFPGSPKRTDVVSPVGIHGGRSGGSMSRPAYNVVSPANAEVEKPSSSGAKSPRPILLNGKTGSVSSRLVPKDSGTKTGKTGSQAGVHSTTAKEAPGRVSPSKPVSSDKLQSPKAAVHNTAVRIPTLALTPIADSNLKKVVQFRGDSDDLLELVKNEGKTNVQPKSYEKEQGASSSPEYEFLENKDKPSEKG